jgi:predicted RNA-binding protein YlxR (DUF448 family)
MGTSADIRTHADASSAGTPERTCLVSRAVFPASDLIRFVADPDGNVVADINQKLPGRGVWIGCHRDLVAQAVAKRVFARGFKREVTADADLTDRVDALLLKTAIQMLSLANKAGVVTTGFAKVEALIHKGKCDTLAQACDASEDGRRKLANRHRTIAADQGRAARIVDRLRNDELSLALGGSNVVHAGLSKGRVTDAFVQAVQRLERYRASSPPNSGEQHDTSHAGGASAGGSKSAARKTG